jgi:hypothetical protein
MMREDLNASSYLSASFGVKLLFVRGLVEIEIATKNLIRAFS